MRLKIDTPSYHEGYDDGQRDAIAVAWWSWHLANNITVACALEKARKHGWWDGAGYNLDPYQTPIKVKTGVIAILGPELPRGKAMRAA